MNTETKPGGKRTCVLPLLLALPILAALAFAAVRFGPAVVRLVNVMIKAAVVS